MSHESFAKNDRGNNMNRMVYVSFLYMIVSIIFCFHCTDAPQTSVRSSDGVKIIFNERGSGETAIVFVHGWSNDKSLWSDQMSHFAEKYHVVAIDLAGFGESGDDRSDWTIASFGKDIAAVMEKLDLKQVVLVGFSMGGSVVVETAFHSPERVSGIVLVDELRNVEMKFPPPVASYMDSLFMDLVTYPTVEKLVKFGFCKKNHDSTFKRVQSMLEGPSRKGWQESLHGYMRWINEDCTRSLQKLSVPVMAINSTREKTEVESFRKYVPSFEVNIIEDSGHLLMWDATEEFNQILEANIQKMVHL